MRISQHLCLLFYQGYLSLLLLVQCHCPASFPSPQTHGNPQTHSIFSMEIKLPMLYPKPSLHHVVKSHSMVSVESQCHQRAASAFPPTKQVVGEVAACDLGVALGRAFCRGGVP